MLLSPTSAIAFSFSFEISAVKAKITSRLDQDQSNQVDACFILDFTMTRCSSANVIMAAPSHNNLSSF